MMYLLIFLWSVPPKAGLLQPTPQFVAEISKVAPHEINYQGWLGSVGDTDTVSVTDTLPMIFRLYDAATGGTLLWSETQPTVEVHKGIFNILLGSITPIPAAIFKGDPLWLEIQVESETLLPRKKLVSVAYAVRAEFADHATYADTAITHISEYDTSVFVYNADSLNGLHSSQFLRSDTSDVATGVYDFITTDTLTGDEAYTLRVIKNSNTPFYGRQALLVEAEYGAAEGFGIVSRATATGSNPVKGIYADGNANNAAVLWGGHFSARQWGSGPAAAAHFCIDTMGTGEHTGTDIMIRGKGPVFGVKSVTWGLGSDNVFGVYSTVVDSGTGVHMGGCFESKSASSASNYGVHGWALGKGAGDCYGLNGWAETFSGTGKAFGVRGIAHSNNNTAYGVYGTAQADGAGDVFGGYFWAKSNGVGSHYGVYTESDYIGIYAKSAAPDKNYAGYFEGNVYVDNLLQLKPRPDFPSPPAPGMVLFNSDSSALFYYNGAQWKKL